MGKSVSENTSKASEDIAVQSCEKFTDVCYKRL